MLKYFVFILLLVKKSTFCFQIICQMHQSEQTCYFVTEFQRGILYSLFVCFFVYFNCTYTHNSWTDALISLAPFFFYFLERSHLAGSFILISLGFKINILYLSVCFLVLFFLLKTAFNFHKTWSITMNF